MNTSHLPDTHHSVIFSYWISYSIPYLANGYNYVPLPLFERRLVKSPLKLHHISTTEMKAHSYEISHGHFLWIHRQMIFHMKFPTTLPDTKNCSLRMRREYRECFRRHRGLAIPTCITARAWRTCRDACRDCWLAVSLEFGENLSRNSRRMRNPQFYVSGKRPIQPFSEGNIIHPYRMGMKNAVYYVLTG